MSIELTSTAFKAETSIPKQYTGDGADQSPPLHWSESPSGTKSIALICDDPDAPCGTWVHWVLFNLPPQTRELVEGVPTTVTLGNGAKQGKNDFGNIGYGGPAPPKGKAHRYCFKVYAVAVVVDLTPGATKAQLEDAMKGHILAEGQLMGTYKRSTAAVSEHVSQLVTDLTQEVLPPHSTSNFPSTNVWMPSRTEDRIMPTG